MRPRRRVYRGRLAELERAHQAGRRPNYGADVDVSSATDEDRHPKSVFASRWLVLECVGGTMPDLRAAALVGKALRNAVMSGYKRTVGEASVPAIVACWRCNRSCSIACLRSSAVACASLHWSLVLRGSE